MPSSILPALEPAPLLCRSARAGSTGGSPGAVAHYGTASFLEPVLGLRNAGLALAKARVVLGQGSRASGAEPGLPWELGHAGVAAGTR